MYTLLLLVVLLAFLLETAAATPTMEYALPASSMHPFNSNLEGLSPLCQLCVVPFFQCVHAMPQPQSYIAAHALYNHPEPVDPLLPVFHHEEAELAPIVAYVTGCDRPALINENVYDINENKTNVQTYTIQEHIEEIYLPGDRLEEKKSPGSRKAPHKRQAPRPGGFSCRADGCEKTFDRACELKRHKKNHLDRSERPHKCADCNEGFLYPKDLLRHERKHIMQPSAQITFFCRFPGCGYLKGFSRRDNLLRHQQKQHAHIVAVA